jgi:hypothetical protein
MKSFRCPQCGLTNWADSPACKRCGFEINQSASADYAGQQFGGYQPQFENYSLNQNIHSVYGQQPKLKTGLALASMIIGCAGFVICGGFLGIGSLTGLILGILALNKAKKKPFEYGGQGYAIAGIVLNGFLVLLIPFMAALIIPNVLAARRAANEASAISTLKTLYKAEAMYFKTSGKVGCGDLMELKEANLIDNKFGSGNKNGYKIQIIPSAKKLHACDITAVPVSSMSGTRSFYVSSEDGIIRAAAKNGRAADANDLPLREYSEEY